MDNGFHIKHCIALAALVKKFNFTVDFLLDMNEKNFHKNFTLFQWESLLPQKELTSIPKVEAFFYCVYLMIFVTGIFGNVLVCYAVFRKKNMQTVTNIFIANLALSDILLCTFAVPFTPAYLFTHEWVFGDMLCHIIPYVQGVSVYISAFSLTFIAIDRFFVVVHPFRARLQLKYCLIIIVFIWISAGLLTLPYGIFIDLIPGREGRPYCDEVWPHDSFRKAFGFTTFVLQFVFPFLIIAYCYCRVYCKLKQRARHKPGANTRRKIEQELERNRRLYRMLIAMVLIFGFSWLPLNVHNLVVDFYIPASSWKYLNGFFLISHAIAMSSTCYNPFLYAWQSENFRREFKTVLPCLSESRLRQACETISTGRLNGLEQYSLQSGYLHQAGKSITEHTTYRENATSVKYFTETDSVCMQMEPRNFLTAV